MEDLARNRKLILSASLLNLKIRSPHERNRPACRVEFQPGQFLFQFRRVEVKDGGISLKLQARFLAQFDIGASSFATLPSHIHPLFIGPGGYEPRGWFRRT